MLFVGALNWSIQETIAPKTNVIQDQLRAQIRSRGSINKQEGKLWVANDQRIYSFEMTEMKDDQNRKVRNLTIFDFSADQSRLQNVYRAPEAVWEKNKIKFTKTAEKQTLNNGQVELSEITDGELPENSNPFNNFNEKPSHLDRSETLEQIRESGSETERRNFEIALEKKYTTLFLPLVITLFTAPFALSLTRRGRVATIGYAVGVWLLFMAVTAVLEQFGLNGLIAPVYAVWSPLFLFAITGVYLISRVRT